MRSGRGPVVIIGAIVLAACGSPRSPSIVGSEALGSPLPVGDAAVDAVDAVAGSRPPASSTTLVEPPPVVAAVASPFTSTSTTTSTTTTVAAPKRITLAFTGDTLAHSPLWLGAARIAAAAGADGLDFRPMLAGLAPILEPVDLAVCHLETPIAPVGEDYSTFPYYGVPAEIVDALDAAGYDHCSTASNHAIDRGAAGIDRTVAVLGAAGLTQSGMARTPDEIEPRLVDVDGVATALLSYTYSYNGLRPPNGEEWRSALIDPDRIVADAAVARRLGAELVVVSLHWGTEGVHEPNVQQRAVADRITSSGLIDLVIGHHAHVIQPIERVNGTWVLFGLGNILSNLPVSSAWPAATQDAAVAVVEIEVDPSSGVTVGTPVVHPTWVDKQAEWTVRVVADELARDDLSDGRRAVLQASWERSFAVIGDFVSE
jgi:poly-gamma-glutamate capsule biosynthesis protein CapA/YwtB (metallophosphatase superfamily)